MSLRKSIKRIVFGLVGAFRYFGTRVYFPPKSGSFLAACEHGIVEAPNVRILTALARPGTVCFDVGANIGLMAVPVLTACPATHVVSFEPSPTVLPFLERTWRESAFVDRWTVIPKAAGTKPGNADFYVTTDTGGLYDGLRDTGRVPGQAGARVEITTLDEEWRRLRRPHVSIIKIDVEGAELDALAGAQECLRSERPAILLEWNSENLDAYGRKPDDLLEFAAEYAYRIFTVPGFTLVEDTEMLQMHMLRVENFILRPVLSAPAV